MKKNKSKFREYSEAIIVAVLLALFIRVEVVEAFRIPSGSMQPTLLIGDHLLVSKSAYGVKLPFTDRVLAPVGEPRRGDVVVFRFPGASDPLIKRVIGLPGETIALRDKMVYINGKKLDDPWGRHADLRTLPPGVSSRDYFGPVTVPRNQYFVMGDNRDQSYDSRLWNGGRGGFVPRRDILGRAVFIHWSWKDSTWDVRWARLGRVIE